MDFPDSKPLQASPLRWKGAIGAVLALLCYAAVIGHHIGAVAGSSDTSGYMNHARLLAWHYVHIPARTIPGLPLDAVTAPLYTPLGFKPAWNGDGLVPTYPTGLPVFILAAKYLVGWNQAGNLTILLHALAGIVATYLLGLRFGLGRPWALAGAAIIALSPLYLFMSMQAMSDVPSLAWTSFAVILALKGREHPLWALAAGAALAIDVLLRPTNILVAAPVAIALGASPRQWILFLLGGLPGAAFFFAHSLVTYGKLITTGYGDTTFAFAAHYIPGTLLHYAVWLPILLTPVVVLNFALPWVGAVRARHRWILGVWFGVFGAFYCTYVFTHQTWWYLRFLLPAAPAMVVGGLLVARHAGGRLPAWADPARSAALALALCLSVLGLGIRKLHPFVVGKEELRYGHLAEWMERNVPHDAVCLAMQTSGALVYYTQFTFLRWDALTEGNQGKVESAIRSSGRPLYAVLFPSEASVSARLPKMMPGHWAEVGNVENVTVWKRDPVAAKP